MKIVNFFPMAVVAWIMVIYMLGVNNHHWYLWLFVGFLVAERLYVAGIHWLQGIMMRAMAREVSQRLAQQGVTPESLFGHEGPPSV